MERGAGCIQIGGEILEQAGRAVKGHNRNAMRDAADHGGNHRAEIAIAVELGGSGAARFHRDHQRQWLAARVLVEGKRLLDAVVGNTEIVDFQRENQLPLAVPHQRGNQHHGGLRAQRRRLRRGGRRGLCKRNRCT
jgi:hypothetical protein